MPHTSRRLMILTGLLLLTASSGYAAPKGAPMPAVVADNMLVTLDYTLTVDGKVVDASKGHGPLKYVQGRGQIIPGLERQGAGLHVGEAKEVPVAPKDGYGDLNPPAVTDVPRTKLPPNVEPKVGMILTGHDQSGRTFQARIAAVKGETVHLDMNHPLAGKTLNFSVKVLEIAPAPATPVGSGAVSDNRSHGPDAPTAPAAPAAPVVSPPPAKATAPAAPAKKSS